MKPALFLDVAHKLSFEKIAMPVKLSDSPEAWQREIASEIFKQIPYLGDYAVNVIIDRVDGERGFAFGSAQVSNKSQAPTAQQEQLPSVRIPLIVRERLLLPMDVFMDGTGVFPMTPTRLREHLFRTDTFEMSSRKPTDQGMIDQLYPPMRQQSGMGAVSGDSTGFGKMASVKTANPAEQARKQMVAFQKAQGNAYPDEYVGKIAGEKPSLIEAIAPTIPDVEADEFVNQVAGDEALKVAAAKNEAFSKLAMTIAATDRQSVEKTAAALVSSIKPTVVQFQKLASGNVKVKWANAGAFMPQEDVVAPEAAAGMGGDKVVEMQPGGTMTVSTNKAQKTTLEDEKIEQVSDFGVFRVQNMDTNEDMAGWCIPIMDFDMHPLEMFVWTDGQQYGVQDEIAGVRVGHDLNLPLGAQPEGNGVFVLLSESSAKCLLPMTINSTATTPDGTVQILGESMFGEEIVLSMAPGLQTIQQIGDNEYALPDTFQWMPLAGETVFLAKQPVDVVQTQQAQAAPSTVDVGSTGGGEFHMEGQPVEKLAREQRQFLKRADAEFLLVSMGAHPAAATALLKQAEKYSKVKIGGMKQIVPLSDLHREMVKKAARTLSDFPYHLRRNLVKEAAVLEDQETADKILAMNFLNPENVSTFAAYLPELDKCAAKLAEMLVAARMGLGQVEEGAIERAMKNLEQVIEGLRALQQKELV